MGVKVGESERDLHAVGVLGLASEKLEVLEVREKLLLDKGLSTLLEGGDGVGIGVLLLKLGLDRLHVALGAMLAMSFLVCCLLLNTAGKGEEARTLEVGEVGLLVERGGLETERVDDVVDLGRSVIEGLLGLLGGSVGTDVYMKVLAGGFPGEW
jgi:hypothetical protein